MSVYFKTKGPQQELHLNNVNTRALLDALGFPSTDELRGHLPVDDVLGRCESYISVNHTSANPKINWSEDPNIGDTHEGVRRLRSLANRSKSGVIEFS